MKFPRMTMICQTYTDLIIDGSACLLLEGDYVLFTKIYKSLNKRQAFTQYEQVLFVFETS
jgi:hypothetical protein